MVDDRPSTNVACRGRPSASRARCRAIPEKPDGFRLDLGGPVIANQEAIFAAGEHGTGFAVRTVGIQAANGER